MKKPLFITLLLSNFLAIGQLKIGVKGGLNLADIQQGVNFKGQTINENLTFTSGGLANSQSTSRDFDETIYITSSPKISFYIGGYIELPINKKGNILLKTELLYSQNGATIDKKEAPSQDEFVYYTSPGVSYSVGQLNIPVLLKFTTNKKISFLAGGYFGTILTAKATNNSGSIVDLKSKLKTSDLGLNIGASYPINSKWSIEAMYNRGLLNLDKTNEKDSLVEVQGLYFNRTIHFGVEYQF